MRKQLLPNFYFQQTGEHRAALFFYFHLQKVLFACIFNIALVVLGLFWCAKPAQAAPLLISWTRAPDLLNVPLANIAAFVVSSKKVPQSNSIRSEASAEANSEAFQISRIPLQIQELNSRNTIEFEGNSYLVNKSELKVAPESEQHGRKSFSRMHRIVLNERHFENCNSVCSAEALKLVARQCAEIGEAPAALVPDVFKLQLTFDGRVAFLVNCKSAVLSVAEPPAVELSLGKRTLSSPFLRYTYSKQNHMLLDDFALREAKIGNATQPEFLSLLQKSEMQLYAKPRYFFPLHFTGDDVRSELKRVQKEPLSVAGQLSFFLDVLSFKISLNLLSEVSMFEDSVHVPVLLNLPVSGSSLRSGSGIFYGFQFANGLQMEAIETDLPRLRADGQAIPFASTRLFEVHNSQFSIAVGMHMPDEFEAMGFAPALALPSDLKARQFPEVASDFGIFYDITRLQKGTHRFDLWFYVGKANERAKILHFARNGVVYSVARITP